MGKRVPAAAQALKIEIITTDTEAVVHLVGGITNGTCTELQAVVNRLAGSTHRIVLDLGDVSEVDRSGLHTLVDLWVSAKQSECCLQLASVGVLKELFCDSEFAAAPEEQNHYPRWLMQDFRWF